MARKKREEKPDDGRKEMALARRKALVMEKMDEGEEEEAMLALIRRSGSDAVGVDEFCGKVMAGMPLERARGYVRALAYVASGNKWREVLAATGLGYTQISIWTRTNKEYGALFKAAKEMQGEAIGAKALDALVEVGVEGEEIPVVSGGEVVATRVVRPVKALELLVKMGDERFAPERRMGAPGGGTTYVIPVLPVLTADAVKREAEARVVEVGEVGRTGGAEGGGSGEEEAEIDLSLGDEFDKDEEGDI